INPTRVPAVLGEFGPSRGVPKVGYPFLVPRRDPRAVRAELQVPDPVLMTGAQRRAQAGSAFKHGDVLCCSLSGYQQREPGAIRADARHRLRTIRAEKDLAGLIAQPHELLGLPIHDAEAGAGHLSDLTLSRIGTERDGLQQPSI